jgi:hypothetical protein
MCQDVFESFNDNELVLALMEVEYVVGNATNTNLVPLLLRIPRE